MSHIFISYSHKDSEYAHKLAGSLKERGLTAWIDDRIDYGTRWPHVIQEHVDTCSAFIVIMTPNSYESEWVQNELTRAKRKHKSIFPLLLEGSEPWLSVETTQYCDVRAGKLPPLDFYERLASMVPVTTGVSKPEPKKKWWTLVATLYEEPKKVGGMGIAIIVLSLLLFFSRSLWLSVIFPSRSPTPTVTQALTATPMYTLTSSLVPSTDTPVPPTNTPRPEMPTNTPPPPTPTFAPPEGMVFVPAGEFILGSPWGKGNDNEHPQRTVYLDAFYIGKYEVTNEQFSQFVDATGYSTDAETAGYGWAWAEEDFEQVEGADWRHPQGPGSSIEGKMDHPVIQVSWNDANAYCQWADKRLPTEAEWEKAARGTDEREYPWGNSAPDGSKLNYCDVNCEYAWKDSSVDDGYVGTAPVGHYEAGKSPYGAYDMAGNAWEWVADWYDADYYSKVPERNPQGPDSEESRVLRGGSWSSDQGYARCAFRFGYTPGYRDRSRGFRVAASPGSP